MKRFKKNNYIPLTFKSEMKHLKQNEKPSYKYFNYILFLSGSNPYHHFRGGASS